MNKYFLLQQYEYSRSGNPTRDCLEECLASLEEAKYGEPSILKYKLMGSSWNILCFNKLSLCISILMVNNSITMFLIIMNKIFHICNEYFTIFYIISGLTFASGLSATTTIMHLLEMGDHVIAMNDLYGGTNRYFRKVLSK